MKNVIELPVGDKRLWQELEDMCRVEFSKRGVPRDAQDFILERLHIITTKWCKSCNLQILDYGSEEAVRAAVDQVSAHFHKVTSWLFYEILLLSIELYKCRTSGE